MRNLLILLFCCPLFGYTQTMSIHLVKYEGNINPIFSKTLKRINISFDKNSFIDSSSFELVCKIDISDRKSELSGVQNDINLGGGISSIRNRGIVGGILSSSLGSSKQYSFRNTMGFALLNKSQFDSLYLFSQKVMKILDLKDDAVNNDVSFFFNVDKLELNADLVRRVNNEPYDRDTKHPYYVLDKKVTLKIDESIFEFSDSEFKNLFNGVLSEIYVRWNSNL